MTITAMAKELNVSTMTVYRRLKKAGIDVDTLRSADGELSGAAVSTIAALFDATGTTDSAPHVTTGDATNDATGDAVTVAVLEARLEAAADTIKRLEEERNQLRAQLEAVSAALEREQTDRAQERLLLTGPGEKRRGFWWWRRRNV